MSCSTYVRDANMSLGKILVTKEGIPVEAIAEYHKEFDGIDFDGDGAIKRHEWVHWFPSSILHTALHCNLASHHCRRGTEEGFNLLDVDVRPP